jgi:hypothetical protein
MRQGALAFVIAAPAAGLLAAGRARRRHADVYALNMSMQDIEPTEALGSEIGEYLMAFAARCKDALSRRS